LSFEITPQNKLDSHHGDIHGHHWDVLKLRAVAVQLQVSTLAELRNGTQHWTDGGMREREREREAGHHRTLQSNVQTRAAETTLTAEFISSDLKDKTITFLNIAYGIFLLG